MNTTMEIAKLEKIIAFFSLLSYAIFSMYEKYSILPSLTSEFFQSSFKFLKPEQWVFTVIQLVFKENM